MYVNWYETGTAFVFFVLGPGVAWAIVPAPELQKIKYKTAGLYNNYN